MKTYKNKIQYALSDECMDKALKHASKKKTNRSDVKDVIEHKEEVKARIRSDILNRNLKPLIHKARRRLDGVQKKERIVSQPFFSRDCPEQWIQRIAIDACEDVLFKGNYFFNCASIKGKGLHFGKKFLARYIKNHQKDVRYCLKIDVRHFYESVDTDVLKQKLSRKIKDDLMLYVLYWIIDNNISVLPDGEIISGGLTLGGYPSQCFANFYLQDFDHYMKEVLKVKFYMRYMDDIVVLGSNKRELHGVLEEIRKYFATIGLEIKQNYQVFKFHYIKKNGEEIGRFIDFMGFKFYRDHTEIRKTTFLRACRVARKIKKADKITLKNAHRIMSYKGWFDDTDSFNAYRKHITSNVSIQKCKNLISKESKLKNKQDSKNKGDSNYGN